MNDVAIVRDSVQYLKMLLLPGNDRMRMYFNRNHGEVALVKLCMCPSSTVDSAWLYWKGAEFWTCWQLRGVRWYDFYAAVLSGFRDNLTEQTEKMNKNGPKYSFSASCNFFTHYSIDFIFDIQSKVDMLNSKINSKAVWNPHELWSRGGVFLESGSVLL